MPVSHAHILLESMNECKYKHTTDSNKGQERGKKKSRHQKGKSQLSDGNILEKSPRLKYTTPTILSGSVRLYRRNNTHGHTASEK